jgi:sulfur-oxidizing protein SoxX
MIRLLVTLAISALLAHPGSIAAQIIWDGDAIPNSLSGNPGDPLRGKSMVTSRQTGLCILCHAGPFPEERFQGNLAPDLRLSIANFNAPQLRARLVDAGRFKPNTIMPSYFKIDHLNRVAPQFSGKTVLGAQDIEDIIAYLLTIQSP